MSNQIFISHSSQDKNIAAALCHYLEERKLRCWIAPRDISVGKNYAEAIIEGINVSRIMIVIFSKHANDSIHVKNEVERAFNRQLIIMPFRTENIIPAQSLEYFLSSTHWLDAVDGNAENYFEELYQNCASLINPSANTDNVTPQETAAYAKPITNTAADNNKKKRTASVPVLLTAAVLLGAAIVFITNKFSKATDSTITTDIKTDSTKNKIVKTDTAQPDISTPTVTTNKNKPIPAADPGSAGEVSTTYNSTNLELFNGSSYEQPESTDNLSFIYEGKNTLSFTGKAAGYLISGRLKPISNNTFKITQGDVTGSLSFTDNNNKLNGNIVIKESNLNHRLNLIKK